MNKQKAVAVWAGCGFILSFFAGLISRIAFSIVLIRAVLFAAVFAVVSVLISYLYEHFLADDGDGEANRQASYEKTSDPKSGSIVDITVGDSDIPEDVDGPQFSVGKIHTLLRPEDITKNTANSATRDDSDKKMETSGNYMNSNEKDAAGDWHTVAAVSSEELKNTDGGPTDKSFIPVTLGDEKSMQSAVNKSMDDDADRTDDELDELPDIDDLLSSSEEESAADSSDVADDGSSASQNKDKQFPRSSSVSAGGEKMEAKDAAVMAKAIQTIMKQDE